MEVKRACQPDNIKWDCLGYTANYRRVMTVFNWIVAVTLIIISMIGMILFKAKSDELVREYSVNVVCPDDILDMKEEAYLDHTQENAEDRIGIMHCYC